MKLGKIISMYMDEHGYSMREFATICGLSPAQISNTVRGQNSCGEPSLPRDGTLIKIAAGMGITLGELLAGLDDDTRIRLSARNPEVSMSSERQELIDKILIATPEQLKKIASIIDLVMQS